MVNVVYTKDFLAHHGIKGQKWGVRRYQNPDGTLTLAGRKRYNDDYSRKSFKQRTKEKYDSLSESYQKLGYSKQEADALSDGRKKTMQKLAIFGGIAITAVTAYGIAKYIDKYMDTKIKPGQLLQTVHKEDFSARTAVGNPFYASFKKSDNMLYTSTIFSHFDKDSKISQFTTNNGFKVASMGSQKKIFNDLMKNDSEFKKYVDSVKSRTGSKFKDFSYDLVKRGTTEDKIHNKFYEALKKKGYGALVDIEDSQIEGWTKKPSIIFDDQVKKLVSTRMPNADDLSYVGKKTMKASAAYLRRVSFTKSEKTVALVSAYSGVLLTSKMKKELDYQKRIDSAAKWSDTYLKEHPESKLTKSELLKMYDKYQK